MTIPFEQQAVARFLTGLSGGEPRETHISAVFVGTDTVWKLKKAVRLPFLDFTTLAAREHFLRRELTLNQPAAPAIYRDVVAISQAADGTLQLGGPNPVDWVLRMAPVPDGDFMDVVADRGGLTPKRLDELGDVVATYHARLPPVADRDSLANLLRIAAGNKQSALASGLPEPAVRAWKSRMDAAIEAQRDWLAKRAGSGCVRRCHGDLHLGNLCLRQGKPVPFDALEFDEDLATIDVAYDLAFLLMDLEHKLNRAAANRVMNRYIARTGDILTAGLPIFLSMRAMIRAHVLSSMGQGGETYFASAQRYLAPGKPVVVAIGGLQGTGKSTLARSLAPELGASPGALMLRSDEIRKRLNGEPPEARLAPAAYAEAGNIATNDRLIGDTREAAASGHAVVVDATFLDRDVRRQVQDAASASDVAFVGIWLQAPMAVLEGRIASRVGDASDATLPVLRRSALDDPGPGDWHTVDATDRDTALDATRRAVRVRCG